MIGEAEIVILFTFSPCHSPSTIIPVSAVIRLQLSIVLNKLKRIKQ